MESSTIAAIATPVGSAGIGIIKISGPDALSIASLIFRRSGPSAGTSESSIGPSLSDIQSHRLYHGHIIDTDKGRMLDEVLVTVMRAPHSYTREDVVEINSHSGTVLLRAILEMVIKKGARLAEPGEFTKRAFLNGRIDLSQAEAVIDIINARTEKALEIASAHINGEFKVCISAIRDALVDIQVQNEAAIDFPEDVDAAQGDAMIEILKLKAVRPLTDLVNGFLTAHVFRDGLNLVVVGRPNVGKSSLMNRLIQKDRVIVSPVPGTTRDFIEEALTIHGIPIIIADTAGLHETEDPVEVIGIKKTRDYICGSDLVIFMVDASDRLTAEDHQIYETVKGKNVILVLNKQDLVKTDTEIFIPERWKNLPRAKISARYNQGIEYLKELIVSASTGDGNLDLQSKIIPNMRQKQAIEQSLGSVNAAINGIKNGFSAELIAIDLQGAIDPLSEVLGMGVGENILNQIFSRFCIGK